MAEMGEVKVLSEVDGLRLHVMRLQVHTFNLECERVAHEQERTRTDLGEKLAALESEFSDRYGVSLGAIERTGEGQWAYKAERGSESV